MDRKPFPVYGAIIAHAGHRNGYIFTISCRNFLNFRFLDTCTNFTILFCALSHQFSFVSEQKERRGNCPGACIEVNAILCNPSSLLWRKNPSPLVTFPNSKQALSEANASRTKVFAPLFTKSGRVQGRALAGSGAEPRGTGRVPGGEPRDPRPYTIYYQFS